MASLTLPSPPPSPFPPNCIAQFDSSPPSSPFNHYDLPHSIASFCNGPVHPAEDAFQNGAHIPACSPHPHKRSRRLSTQQVAALETAFEVGNRLEPDRKVQLASQLALHSRQVAVWFQNRRARWKTKQLERDYFCLQKNLESLKADREELIKEKEKLEAELLSLRADVNNQGKEKLEEPMEGKSSPLTESCSCMAMTGSEDATLAWKEKDRLPITDDSEGSATNSAGSPSITQNSAAAISMGENMPNPGDMETQSETVTLLELSDLYDGRAVYDPGSIEEEDIFYGEMENGSGFVPLDWWAASCCYPMERDVPND